MRGRPNSNSTVCAEGTWSTDVSRIPGSLITACERAVYEGQQGADRSRSCKSFSSTISGFSSTSFLIALSRSQHSRAHFRPFRHATVPRLLTRDPTCSSCARFRHPRGKSTGAECGLELGVPFRLRVNLPRSPRSSASNDARVGWTWPAST